jgi:hypothetical protein
MVIAAAAMAVAIPAASAGTAHAGDWQTCSAPVYTITGYELHATSSGLEARSPMNCESARYAYAHAFGIARRNWRRAAVFSDGYVTWHRRVRYVSQPPGGRCGTYRSVVTYTEYSSGTAFRFHLRESGC